MKSCLFIFLFVFVSYYKGIAQNPGDSTSYNQVNSLPHKVGDTWTYLVHSKPELYTGNYIGTPDTVHATIIRKSIYHGDSVNVWQFKAAALRQYNGAEIWVTYRSKKVKIFEHPTRYDTLDESRIPWPSFNWPLKIGEASETGMHIKTSITDTVSVSVKAGAFTNCYEIQKNGGGFNCYLKNTFWLKENVGFVKFYISVDDMCHDWANGEWELISYHLQ